MIKFHTNDFFCGNFTTYIEIRLEHKHIVIDRLFY